MSFLSIFKWIRRVNIGKQISIIPHLGMMDLLSLVSGWKVSLLTQVGHAIQNGKIECVNREYETINKVWSPLFPPPVDAPRYRHPAEEENEWNENGRK